MGTSTAMKNATAVAARVPRRMWEWSVLAAFKAQVNWVHAHQTNQKIKPAERTVGQVMWPWNRAAIWVTEKTNTRSKKSSTNVTL